MKINFVDWEKIVYGAIFEFLHFQLLAVVLLNFQF